MIFLVRALCTTRNGPRLRRDDPNT